MKLLFDSNAVLDYPEANESFSNEDGKMVVEKLVSRKPKDAVKNKSEYFGCIARPIDGLEIQRSMRNEWN